MTRDDLEARLRDLREHGGAEPGEPAMREMADRIWREVRTAPVRRSRRWVWLAPVAAAAGAAALLLLRVPTSAPLPEPLPATVFDLQADEARQVLTDIDAEMDDDLLEFEQSVNEPASAGEALLEMDETQLRALLDALQKEIKG